MIYFTRREMRLIKDLVRDRLADKVAQAIAAKIESEKQRLPTAHRSLSLIRSNDEAIAMDFDPHTSCAQ